MSAPAKIPADVERSDKVLAGLSARQVSLIAATAVLVYAGWFLARAIVPAGVYAMVAMPVAAAGVVLTIARRDGIGLDEFARAALAYRLRPRHHHTNPAGPGRADPNAGVPGWMAAHAHHTQRRPRSAPLSASAMPARGIHTPVYGPSDIGLLDLGAQGQAVIAACSTVNFALRTETEQQGLIDCFARLLHAQTGPLQILVRAHPVDLTPTLAELAHAATTLAHPALRAAAAGHHHWLAELAGTEAPLSRQVLIVLREPTPHNPSRGRGGRGGDAGQARLVQRLAEVRRALAPAEITVTALSPAQIAVVLATTTDPSRHRPSVAQPHPGLPLPTTAGPYLPGNAQ